MRGDIVQVDDLQIRGPGDSFADGRDRGDATAGEYIAFDKIHRSFVAFEYLISDGYGLQGHQAVFFQQTTAGTEKGIVIMMADSLDHFNGNQFVEFSAQIAVVLFKQGDTILQPRDFDTVLGKLVLLV